MTFWFYIIVALLGLSVGSFINSFSWRLYKEKTFKGRSVCPHCGHTLSWQDNIPLLSFLTLKAKCRYCSKQISWQYPIVEFLTSVLFVVAFYFSALSPDFSASNLGYEFLLLGRNWLLIGILTTIFVMDFRWYIIVDKVSLPACVVIFFMNIWLGMPWQNILLAGLVGGGFFALQFIISKGKWIGGGDIRLGLLMGLALGWPLVAVALMIAYVTGSVFGVIAIIFGKKGIKSQIPFGTFLSFATIVTLFWGDIILNWYLSLIV